VPFGTSEDGDLELGRKVEAKSGEEFFDDAVSASAAADVDEEE
jgi:hypothetical protein